MKKIHWMIVVLVAIVLIFFFWNCRGNTDDQLTLDCSKDETLSVADAVANPKFREVRQFNLVGECANQKTIVFDRDNITLSSQSNGLRSAKITGKKTEPIISVTEAQNIVIRDLVVEGSEEGTNVGILVRGGGRKKGSSVAVTNVKVQGKIETGLCVIGTDREKYKHVKAINGCKIEVSLKDQGNRKPQYGQDPKKHPVQQKPTYNEEPLSSSSIWNALISDAVAQNLESVTVDICNSDFISTGAEKSGIVAISSRITSHNSDPGEECVTHVEGYDEFGALFYFFSTFDTKNTRFFTKDNGKIGFGAGLSSALVLNDTTIVESNDNVVDFYLRGNSTASCFGGSKINAVIGDPVPPGCKPER